MLAMIVSSSQAANQCLARSRIINMAHCHIKTNMVLFRLSESITDYHVGRLIEGKIIIITCCVELAWFFSVVAIYV